MILATCLVACTLAAGQQANPQTLSQAPRLIRGQELLYTGSYTEEFRKPKATISQRFQIENRILVLESGPTGAKIAILTILQSEKGKTNPDKPDPRSVCLAIAHVDLKNRLTTEQGEHLDQSIGVPPKVEAGPFIEVPDNKLASQKEWIVHEPGRPRHYWRRTGIESVDGQMCYKIIGAQQSDDWDHPNAGKTAWRRQDTVWISPRTGFPVRYERIMEQREPAVAEPTYRSTANFHLESSLVCPGQLFHDREAEVNLWCQYSQVAEASLREPGIDSPRRLGSLSAKIGYHCDTRPPTPYREALLELQRRLESASRGELPPIHGEPGIRQATVKVASTAAPDFSATDLATHSQIRLELFRGQPLLLVFYNPTSMSAAEILRFAQSIRQSNQAHVLGLSVAVDFSSTLKQCINLGLDFPIAAGAELRSAFGVDATPKLIVIDSDGRIRRTFDGWGDETPALIRKDLGCCSQSGEKVEN